MQRQHVLWGSAITALLTPVLALAAENQAVGRWDLTVMISPAEKAPTWLEIRQEGGKFVGNICGEVSGTHQTGEIKVNGDKIEFKSNESPNPEGSYAATMKNNTMNGTYTLLKDQMAGKKGEKKVVKKKGTAYPLIGIKFIPEVDVTGDWKMKLGEEKADLNLKQTKMEVSGKMHGKTAGEISKGSVKGEHLALAIKTGEKSSKLEAKVKGDELLGTFEHADGKSVKFSAHRERKWGEPIKLFNGKNLDGWETMEPPGEKAENKWSVVDGVMTNAGAGRNIKTKQKDFSDFKLHVEFRVPPKGNSGVYLRGRYEIQVHDDAGQKADVHSCGALYSRVAPSTNASKPAGEWQTFDITLVGQYVTVVHNGKTVIDNQEIEGITGGAIDSHEFEGGPIYLQGDHGKIEYRNIVLTPAK